jgi:phosphoglycerate dehydrogenase-like enzyme
MADRDRLRVHFKNNRAGEEIFRVTPERLAAACRRHPEIAAEIETLIDWDLDTFDASMSRADVLVTWDLPTDGLARRAPNLKCIHIIGAGVDHMAPFDWLPKGVALTNNSGVHVAKFADYAACALLMLNAAVPRLAASQRQRRWDPVFTRPIAGKTVAVVGVGAMGGVVARIAKGLGLRVLGVRRGGRPARHVDEMVTPERLLEILPRADFVVVATPLTPETEGMVGTEAIGRMKPGAGLVNVGRAPVVDHRALVAALREGRLSGAVLDVHEPEPLPPESDLWAAPNLLITPHVAADDLADYTPLTLDLVFENLRRLLAGKPLLNRVRPRLGY